MLGTLALEINIMRRVIVATLLVSPMLLHAQASSPAQPQTAKLVQPAALGSEADHNTAGTTTPIRVSTGVNAPKLVYTVDVQSDGNVNQHARDGYAVTVHRYAKPGQYLVRVERTDRRGATATARLVVVVEE